MTCDSADRARVEEVVKAAVDTFGSIDVIVNNGQAIVPSAPVEDTTYENMLAAWQSGTIGSLNYVVIVLIVCAGLLAFVVLYNLTNIWHCQPIFIILTILLSI